MKYKGIIFDLDGVICSTDEYHYQAWKRLADRLGIPFDRQTNDRLRGVSRMASLDIILETADVKCYTEEEKTALAAEKNEAYRALLAQMGPADLPGEMRDTLELLNEMGVRMAIGSSSKNTPLILERIGLAGWFDAVADGNCITRSKPDPEVFLKAAEMLGLPPAEAWWWRTLWPARRPVMRAALPWPVWATPPAAARGTGTCIRSANC